VLTLELVGATETRNSATPRSSARRFDLTLIHTGDVRPSRWERLSKTELARGDRAVSNSSSISSRRSRVI
jgi:hypothetical protein